MDAQDSAQPHEIFAVQQASHRIELELFAVAPGGLSLLLHLDTSRLMKVSKISVSQFWGSLQRVKCHFLGDSPKRPVENRRRCPNQCATAASKSTMSFS